MGRVRTSDLQSRVRFERCVETADGAGGAVRTWTPIALSPGMWAEVLPTGSSEDDAGDATHVSRQYRIRIRRRTDLTTAMRVVRGQQLLNITAINPDPENRGFVLLDCEAIDDAVVSFRLLDGSWLLDGLYLLIGDQSTMSEV